MINYDVIPALEPAATVDVSPLRVEAEAGLQTALATLATAQKTYALVYRAQALVGIFSVTELAAAAGQRVDFTQAVVGQWMIPLEVLTPLPIEFLAVSIRAEKGLSKSSSAQTENLDSFYQPVVDAANHWLGMLTPDGFYAPETRKGPVAQPPMTVANSAELQDCQLSLSGVSEQQERLALALKGAQMGTWDWNLQQSTLVLSAEAEQLLGLTSGEFDGQYETLLSYVHREDRDTVHQTLHQAVRLGQRYGVEFRVWRRDGQVRWLMARGEMFNTEQMQPRLVGITLDISSHKQAEAELIIQTQRERLVGQIAQRIRNVLDLGVILEQTVVAVKEFIEADRVIILKCAADMSGEVIQEACTAPYPSMMGWSVRDPWSVGEKFLAHYREGRGMAVEDIYAQNLPEGQLRFLEYFHIKAEIVVPLLQGQTLWGLLIAHQCQATRLWRTADVRLLQSLAIQVGIAIQQATMHHKLTHANQQLKRLAYLDGLTQVANRRRFEQHLDSEWRRMAREKSPLSLVLGDIDYFKQFNDRYGHQAGDNCLRLVARTLSRTAKRPGDLVARYGGEEFVIILPNTDLVGAETVAEDMRGSVRRRRIPHEGSSVDAIVTMSLGVASCTPSPALTPALLLKWADEALYAAKKGGRDQVRLAATAQTN
ncbi:MAG: diguanylate cyclase domain-containing protein [Nodosilinea sp.]